MLRDEEEGRPGDYTETADQKTSHDHLVDEVRFLSAETSAETPAGLPRELRDEAICAEQSGTPFEPLDQGQVRNQFTIGELLNSISVDHLGDRQATLNELLRIADIGVDLFYAAIGHPDVTPKFLREARRRWGPLADVARLVLFVAKPRKRGDQHDSHVMLYAVAQPVQLSPEILREMADMDLLPHDEDPFWDEYWDELVAHLGGVPQAVEAGRKAKLAGQQSMRGWVVAAVKSRRRLAKRHLRGC